MEELNARETVDLKTETLEDANRQIQALLGLHDNNLRRIDLLRGEIGVVVGDLSALKEQMQNLVFWKPLGGVGRGPVMNVCERTDAGPDGTSRTLIFTYLSGATSEYRLDR